LDDDCLEPPLGILYMATILRQRGIECSVCDLSGLGDDKTKWQADLEFGEIYAFSTYSVTYRRTLEVKKLIQERINPDAIFIGGGHHVTAMPGDCINDFDIIITGEAEKTFPEVVSKILSGTVVKGVIKGQPVTELDTIPFPDFNLVDLGRYHRIVEGKPSLSLVSSRGCPFKCAFCNSRISDRGSLRFRSADNVVTEICELIKSYGIRHYRFNDDLFTFSKKRVFEIAELLIKKADIIYRVFAQARTLTPDICNILYESGCRHVSIGIESMSDRMLKLLEKGNTAEQNSTALDNCKKAGLKVRIYLMVGFPGETEETVKESLEKLKQCHFDEFVVYSFIPYPGTPVWHNPAKWGIKNMDKDFTKYVQVGKRRSTCFVVETKDFTSADVERWRRAMIDELERRFCWAGQSPDNK